MIASLPLQDLSNTPTCCRGFDSAKRVGRKDDVIVLGTGEKTVPIPLEGHIGAHPLVKGVIAFGRGHQQVGILVEAKPGSEVDPTDHAEVMNFRNAIWPRVEEANHDAPGFSRIFKEMILIVDPSRPLPRAGKGNVQRKRALELYAQDMEDLYKVVEDSASAHSIPPPSSWDVLDVQNWLAEHAASIHGGRAVTPEADMFEQGFDSATFIRNRIIGALRGSSDAAVNATARQVPQNFVFQYPTLASLARAVTGLMRSGQPVELSRSEEIGQMIRKYTALLPECAPDAGIENNNRERIILLTGTTGNLGAHVLALLLKDEGTQRVYAVNRGEDLVNRQRAAFNDAQLPLGLLDSPKLSLLSADFTEDSLGLPQEDIDDIRKTVTHVVHAAWRVDFNLALSSFESLVAGAVRLLSMAPAAHYLFMSSISIAAGWNVQGYQRDTYVPEAALHEDIVAAATSGYGMSKYVVEEVLSNAYQKGFKTTSIRIGQVSGTSQSGAWNTSEWVPSIVKSSLALGVLPNSNNVVSWVPMDVVARTVVDVVLGPESPELINVVHPHPVKWIVVFEAIQDELGVALSFISFHEWVNQLEAVPDTTTPSDLGRIPGLKLLETFRALGTAEMEARPEDEKESEFGGLPLFETNKACGISQTLATITPLDEHDARAWYFSTWYVSSSTIDQYT
ncbi:hypothetical protein EVJ58_g8699 [Rhodofomes roseus]|uniref:Thioester reductase (TE) domain-containing protein n=1 Tax=Rhodofomes roseus TaxID=34475 RepID=A0A4Y9XWS4_9APHY|nr:hypothetical protein EVJ58_g8699 [Rhodofomes roseus]